LLSGTEALLTLLLLWALQLLSVTKTKNVINAVFMSA